MASKTKAAQKEKEKEEAPEKEASETPDTPLPILDLSDAAVKKLIRSAKKRGDVTHVQNNSVSPSEDVNSEQIEDVLAMFSEMGVNVVETEGSSEDGEEAREETEEEADEEAESEGGELVEVQQKVPAKSAAKEPTERTDDPVRMYLRDMGSVELLSLESEIAIAKRIEAGREAMIAGLCESPLTFQAIIIWRDELNEGKVFLRDIISVRSIVKLISKHYYMSEEAIMSARETAELLLLVGRLVQAEGYDGELSPAQWMALRFFARANSVSRTPSAFAEFPATTRGTASPASKAP